MRDCRAARVLLSASGAVDSSGNERMKRGTESQFFIGSTSPAVDCGGRGTAKPLLPVAPFVRDMQRGTKRRFEFASFCLRPLRQLSSNSTEHARPRTAVSPSDPSHRQWSESLQCPLLSLQLRISVSLSPFASTTRPRIPSVIRHTQEWIPGATGWVRRSYDNNPGEESKGARSNWTRERSTTGRCAMQRHSSRWDYQ